jgi:hypothetical protein
VQAWGGCNKVGCFDMGVPVNSSGRAWPRCLVRTRDNPSPTHHLSQASQADSLMCIHLQIVESKPTLVFSVVALSEC